MTEKFLVVYYRLSMLVKYRMDNNAFIIHSLLYKHTLRLYLQTSILHVVTCIYVPRNLGICAICRLRCAN